MSAVKWVPRALRWRGISVAALAGVEAALFYFINVPAPEQPYRRASRILGPAAMQFDGAPQ